MSATHFSGPVVSTAGFQNGASSYESITGAKTITAADNGKTFGLNAAAGAAITMPTAASAGAGWKIRLRVETAFATTGWVATFAASEMAGNIGIVDIVTTVDGSFTASGNVITFTASAETVGDWCDIECNGSVFFVSGIANLTTGIALT